MGSWWRVATCAGLALLLACGSGGNDSKVQGGDIEPPPPPPPPPPPEVKAPVAMGDFTFWGPEQGLLETVWDVSADEGGNVYVAAGDAVYAKKKADPDFKKFTPADAGLTTSCDEAKTKPCNVIAVAGSTPGKAIFGYQGAGIYDNDADPVWMKDSGGADVVTFDGATMTMRKERHVFIASPPKSACEAWANPPTNTICYEWDPIWTEGRKKMRTVQRIAVNHDQSRALSYGDVMFSGQHATLSILVVKPDERGFPDLIKGDPYWLDTKGVWEHHHPAIYDYGRFLTGEGWAVAIDPTTNVPWFANQFRMTSMPAYATDKAPDWRQYWGEMIPGRPHLTIWRPEANPDVEAERDNVMSISFCDDGTMWVGSYNHGLAVRRPGSDAFDLVAVPSWAGGATAVACDPTDDSVWVGFSWGGFGRLKGGGWQELVDATAVPKFAVNPVQSIQIDRWSSPRTVYFAHRKSRNGPGGVTAYAGP